jgi:hypothetical protein
MAAGDVIVISESPDAKKGNYFDGTDDYVLHDAHAVERVAANDTTGTYTAWIYPNGIAQGCILSAGDNDNANEYYRITLDSSNTLATLLREGGATQFDTSTSTTKIPARTWTHIAVVQNGTRPLFYINGVLITTVTTATATDLTAWYDDLANCDKFAIGVLESNNTHTVDFNGAIGQVKYFAMALNSGEIMKEYLGEAHGDRATAIAAALRLNVTMEDNGTTDSGLGLDNGTLTGHAHYGGEISTWSQKIENNSSGHAAEFINTFKDGSKYVSVIKRGD